SGGGSCGGPSAGRANPGARCRTSRQARVPPTTAVLGRRDAHETEVPHAVFDRARLSLGGERTAAATAAAAAVRSACCGSGAG
ncbi:unnamed protein product, partial [Ectocarpus sp. 12 AP-2014]